MKVLFSTVRIGAAFEARTDEKLDMIDGSPLSVEDRFAIFEQMNLHHQRIDAGWGRAQPEAYPMSIDRTNSSGRCDRGT